MSASRLPGVAAILLLALLLGWMAPPVRAAATMPFASPVSVTVDGRIGPSEYPGSYVDSVTGIEVYWVHDATNVTVGIVSPGLGWVGIGFGPTGVIMDGANLLIGYVAGGTTVLSDEFGIGLDHSPDTTLGGRDDVLAQAGNESNGRTTIEFRYPLDTGDTYDVALRPGRTYGIVLAYQATADDLVTMHTAAAFLTLTLEPPPSPAPTRHVRLDIGWEGGWREGETIDVLASVRGDDGRPLRGAVVDFYVNTSVGLGHLGTVDADEGGMAACRYTFLSPGEFTFIVRFSGDVDYLPEEASIMVVAQASGGSGSPWIPDLGIRIVVFAVLGGVALAYAFSLRQVFGIRRLGLDAELSRPPQDRGVRGTEGWWDEADEDGNRRR